MLRNMVCNLFLAEAKEDQPRRITTTVPKAKEARRLAERVITLGKKGTLHARRRALALLRSKRAVKAVFDEIAALYNDRNGGYTRILRLAKSRLGDGADLCYFELVAEPVAATPGPAEPVAPRRRQVAPAQTEEEMAASVDEQEGAERPAEEEAEPEAEEGAEESTERPSEGEEPEGKKEPPS